MGRKNNIEDMTIREQIENVKENFCQEYCKWYDNKEHRIEMAKKCNQHPLHEIIEAAEEDLLQTNCHGCPLTRL